MIFDESFGAFLIFFENLLKISVMQALILCSKCIDGQVRAFREDVEG
jgi:hypothetical protein